MMQNLYAKRSVTHRNADKRYGWFRLYHDAAAHERWAKAANTVGCSVAETFAVAIYVMNVASKSKPRGCIEDFDPEGCAAVLRLPTERVEAIMAAFAGGRVPWIHQGCIQEWDDRQPKREDATNAERQQRYRNAHSEQKSVTSSNVTLGAVFKSVTSRNVPPIDKEQDKTTSETVSARPPAPNHEVTEAAGSLATALPSGALARQPGAEQVPSIPTASPVAKKPMQITRAELDELLMAKRARGNQPKAPANNDKPAIAAPEEINPSAAPDGFEIPQFLERKASVATA